MDWESEMFENGLNSFEWIEHVGIWDVLKWFELLFIVCKHVAFVGMNKANGFKNT